MDLKLRFRCLRCGTTFTRNFIDLPHGKPVKCVFCGIAPMEIAENRFALPAPSTEGSEQGAREIAPEAKFNFDS